MNPRALFTAAVVAVGLTAVPAPAQAGLLQEVLSVSILGGGPLIRLPEATPGMSGTGRMTVTNDGPTAAMLHLRVVDVVNDDNGCNQPEQQAGDTTCGPDGGELGDALQLAVWIEPGPGIDERLQIFSGSVNQLRQGAWAGGFRSAASRTDTPELPETEIPGGAAWVISVDYGVPSGTGNETQSDRLAFDFEVALGEPVDGEGSAPPSDVPSGSDIEGIDQDAGGSVAGPGAQPGTLPGPDAPRVLVPGTVLPVTGNAGPDTSMLVLVATAVSVLGLVVRRAARRPADIG